MLFSPRAATSDFATWSAISAMLLAFLSLQRGDPFSFAPRMASLMLTGVGVLAGVAIHCRRAGMERVGAASIAFLQMSLFTFLGIFLSYALAAQGRPLWDEVFAAGDAALGLNWRRAASAVDDLPVLAWLCGAAYHSLIPQMIVAILSLSAAGRLDVLRTMICAAVISGFLAILCSGPLPAMGNLFDPGDYPNLWPSIAWLHADLISGLRNGSVREFALSNLMGIVTFPSYHAALATIFLWAFRHLPRFGGLGALWAGATILATPLGGGHYAIDTVAGIALALACVPSAKRLASIRPMRLASLQPTPFAQRKAPAGEGEGLRSWFSRTVWRRRAWRGSASGRYDRHPTR